MSTSSDVIPGSSPSYDNARTKQGAGVGLAPVRFGQSRRLWQLELAVYLVLLFCSCIALFPILQTAWYWPLLLITFVSVIGGYLWRTLRSRHSSLRMLYCTRDRWYLTDQGGEREVSVCDEILFWPQIIILPVRSGEGMKSYLVLTSDAMEADDWRRLRVFLNNSPAITR